MKTSIMSLWMAGVVLLVGVGCAKRAPTSYELDARAGHPVPPEDWKDKHWRGRRPPVGHVAVQHELSTTSTLAPATEMPARIEPVVKKIWIADRLLDDGSWLQGTWMYVEVEPAKWLYEVDPYSSPFASPAPRPMGEDLP